MSKKLPATAHINAVAPRVTQTMAVKARLDPALNKPYFEPTHRSGGCIHMQFGVRLDKQTQRAYCLNCREEIALFDALWNYHHAEDRLIGHLHQLDEHDKREVAKKERDKERRPFMRAVKSWKAVHDMELKSEPVVARIYTLECGHTRKMDGDRSFDRVHCHECQSAAAAAIPKPRAPK